MDNTTDAYYSQQLTISTTGLSTVTLDVSSLQGQTVTLNFRLTDNPNFDNYSADGSVTISDLTVNTSGSGGVVSTPAPSGFVLTVVGALLTLVVYRLRRSFGAVSVA